MEEDPKPVVVVADDYEATAENVALLIESDLDVRTAVARNGIEALELIERLKADVAILDVDMPGLTGIEVAERLHGQPGAPVCLAFTGVNDINQIRATGFFEAVLPKSSGVEFALMAVRWALRKRGKY